MIKNDKKYNAFTSAAGVRYLFMSSLAPNENKYTTTVSGMSTQLKISHRVLVICATIKRHFMSKKKKINIKRLDEKVKISLY